MLFPTVLHSEATASTAPAALKSPGFVISTLTGYFHSINLAQPDSEKGVSGVVSSTLEWPTSRDRCFGSTHPNMHISFQSTCRGTAPTPLSIAIPTVVDFPAILARHRTPRWERRRWMSRPRRMGGNRFHRCRQRWAEQSPRKRRTDRTFLNAKGEVQCVVEWTPSIMFLFLQTRLSSS